jgi:signal peptidase I
MALNPQIKEDLQISDYGNVNYSTMTKESANTLKGYSNIKSISPNISPKEVSDPNNPVFPNKYPINVLQDRKLPDYKWNVDNFGPIIIPKKGWTVKLDGMTFPLYERCIEVYENNKVQISGNDILINGKKADTYTFKMNYYWMMGDNRHGSQDSRYWGFVPEDHVVGEAWLIWMSWNKGVRWSRLFQKIK